MTAEKPGTPNSAIVGTFGISDDRDGLATASALSVPAWIWPITGRIDSIIIETCPPIRSVMALPLPLYGILVSLMLALRANISVEMWPTVPGTKP